jgi:hypothetical protein
LFIWVALDAQLFVHELWQRLAPGAPPVFTTDGLRLYFYALTAHFGHWVPTPGKRWPVWQVDPQFLYGQVHKVKVATHSNRCTPLQHVEPATNSERPSVLCT